MRAHRWALPRRTAAWEEEEEEEEAALGADDEEADEVMDDSSSSSDENGDERSVPRRPAIGTGGTRAAAARSHTHRRPCSERWPGAPVKAAAAATAVSVPDGPRRRQDSDTMLPASCSGSGAAARLRFGAPADSAAHRNEGPHLRHYLSGVAQIKLAPIMIRQGAAET